MARSVLVELLGHVRWDGGRRSRPRRYVPAGIKGTEMDHQELARAIGELLDRYRDRVPAHTLRQIIDAASAGKWENAIDQLIMSLYARAESVTSWEREELRTMLKAMNMPGNCVDNLRGADKPSVPTHPLML